MYSPWYRISSYTVRIVRSRVWRAIADAIEDLGDPKLADQLRTKYHVPPTPKLAYARQNYSSRNYLFSRVLISPVIRKSEERFQDKSHIVFLLQEPDLRYLVENIWGGQSSLSAVRDVFELTLQWSRNQGGHWPPNISEGGAWPPQ